MTPQTHSSPVTNADSDCSHLPSYDAISEKVPSYSSTEANANISTESQADGLAALTAAQIQQKPNIARRGRYNEDIEAQNALSKQERVQSQQQPNDHSQNENLNILERAARLRATSQNTLVAEEQPCQQRCQQHCINHARNHPTRPIPQSQLTLNPKFTKALYRARWLVAVWFPISIFHVYLICDTLLHASRDPLWLEFQNTFWQNWIRMAEVVQYVQLPIGSLSVLCVPVVVGRVEWFEDKPFYRGVVRGVTPVGAVLGIMCALIHFGVAGLQAMEY
ncbi:hypothetical protein LTR64_007308 [Lithohypha guttulata]|uniref:uncharacterized protein n=1 Tax=Lithohypha guttulata TaxID=1690604 RepID=UPI002DDFB871|nr:hypothetical protein LTR51_004136 [Lithohypha guttulata]